MLILRFILGCIFLAVVWFATWPFESGDFEPLLYALIFGLVVSSFASWLSCRKNIRNKFAPVLFSAPFVLPALLSVPFDGIYRPFIYWCICVLAAFLISLFCDLLVFRKIVDEEENS